MRRSQNAAKAAWKDRKYAAGLCITCGKRPHRPKRTRCVECSANECRRQRWEKTALVRRCGLCREFVTHDRRRCAA